MDCEIKTVYRPEDLEGLQNAYLLGKKHMKILNKISGIISTLSAVILWCIGALFIIGGMIDISQNFSIQGIFAYLPMTLVFILLGLWVYSVGHRGFKIRYSWKMYPFKNTEIAHHFYPDKYIIAQPSSETINKYSIIIRLFEDEKRFYLFTSPQTAHILPKRDIDESIDVFRDFITKATGLEMEYGNKKPKYLQKNYQ